MRRFFIGAMALLVVAGLAHADRVISRDRASKDGKPKADAGTIIGDTVAGVRIKPAVGPEKSITAADIIDIQFENLGVNALSFGDAQKAETTSPTDAIAKYAALKVDPKTPLGRYVEYKSATLRAVAAEEAVAREADDAKALTDAAMKALLKFKADHPNSWQITDCTRRLANLQSDGGDAAAAVKSFQDLLAAEGLSQETKDDVELLVIDLLLRGKDYQAAEARVGKVAAVVAAGSPNKGRLDVLKTACAALSDPKKLPEVAPKLQAIVEDKAREPALRAQAQLLIGDCQLAAGQKREALWSYLWVDVVYNQDKVEHVKALERLTALFGDLNDPARADIYRAKLRSLR